MVHALTVHGLRVAVGSRRGVDSHRLRGSTAAVRYDVRRNDAIRL